MLQHGSKKLHTYIVIPKMHPHAISHHCQAFPINFPRFPKVLQESFVLLQDFQNTLGMHYFDHISKIVHLLPIFYVEMYKDDSDMFKNFQRIPMHTFQEIGHHHL